MNRIAAEVAKEVGVLFEHLHAAAGTGEKEASHYACGTAAGNDEVEI